MYLPAPLFRAIFVAAWLAYALPTAVWAHEDTPTRKENSSGIDKSAAPTAPWGTGATTLSPSVNLAIEEAKGRYLARAAYLASEAATYGAAVSAAAQADRDTAAGIFQYLDNQGNYVDNLRLQDLTVLPVGMKKSLSGGNGSIELGFMKAVFLPTYAELTVFVRVRLPSPDPNSSIKERELFFGADHVKFYRDGGITGEFNLVLLGDFIQPLGNMTLRFKGGFDRNTGATEDLTYARVSCDGLQGLGIAGEVVFPRSMLVPINPVDGAVQAGQVRGNFRIDAPDFNDLVAGVTMMPFAVTGYEKFGFVLNNAMLDLSDKRNAPSVVFPAGYFDNVANSTPDGSTSGQGINNWRGVYIHQFKILLPPEFKERGTSARLQIEATNLLFDRSGVSGKIGMQRAGNPYNLTASGWALSLSDFALEFEKNKLVGGGFGGFLSLPIAPGTPIQYRGLINRQADYTLSLSNVSALSMPLWRATAELAPNSIIELNVINGTFRPKATLHGRLGIYTNLNGDTQTKENAKFAFEGIDFEGLTLQTEKPYISADYFGYEKDIRLAGFPVTVHRVGAVFAGDTVGLRFDMKVNLMEDAISGGADFTVVGKFLENNGIHEWKFERVRLSRVCVKGTTSTFSLDGCVAIYENDPDYGDGFGGFINFMVDDPAKFKVNIEAKFGAQQFRYWYVAGGATIPGGVSIAGPLKMNYIYASAYRRMKPTFSAGRVIYRPESSLGLGFKAVVGLEAIDKNTFEGSAGFEMAFNSSGGLNSLGFYGEGVLAGGFKGITNKALYYKQKFDKIVDVSQATTAAESFTKKDLDQKAQTEYQAATDAKKGAIIGRLSMLYDRPSRTLHGDAEVYVDIAGIVRGVGSGGKAGSMVMHFDPNEWYVHIGHPDAYKRVGLLVGFPGLNVRTTGYFMIGHRIPEIPAPPAEIIKMFRNWNPNSYRRTTIDKTDLQSGRGMAFGADLNLNWDINLWIPYLHADAVAGFDILLRNNTSCRPANEWYGRGQVYAFLQGEVGVRIMGKHPLVSLAAATLLEGGMPNPAWLSGNMAFRLKLGRLFNKTVDFDLALNKSRICR